MGGRVWPWASMGVFPEDVAFADTDEVQVPLRGDEVLPQEEEFGDPNPSWFDGDFDGEVAGLSDDELGYLGGLDFEMM